MMESRCKWVRLGDYIEMRHENNSSLKYGAELIEGINSNGEFQTTKAITENINLKPYKVVRHGDIVYNPSRLNIGSLAYRIGEMCIVSHLYQVFYVKEEYTSILSAEFLTLYLRRSEFYRYVDYDNYGSQRAEYNLRKLGELRIPLPSLAEQQKVVNAWKHSATCDSVRIGDFIKVNEITNKENKAYSVLGLNKTKSFMPTVANTESVNLKNYKVVSHGMFAYSGMQTGRDLCIRIAYYDEENPCLISPAYTTFNIDESKGLLAVYFMMIFKRSEMDRLGWFYSDSSVRSNLDWERFVEIEIPLPPLSVQQAIVNIYNCANEAKKIAAEADRMSREVCPALIQHVINNN